MNTYCLPDRYPSYIPYHGKLAPELCYQGGR